MIDLFIALFGGLYYAGAIASNKANKRYESFESKKREERIKQMTDTDLEHEITEYMSLEKNHKEILEELEEDLRFIYGDEKDKFTIYTYMKPMRFSCTFNGYNEVAFYLLLAHRGKVAFGKYITGFVKGNTDKERELNKKIYQRIEYLLNSRGIDLQLYLDPELTMHGELTFEDSKCKYRDKCRLIYAKDALRMW